jgi:hypothetical protein
MAKKKNHPYADLFPMMTAQELESLADDIKENGLRQPIVLYNDMVLDGRNRLAACERAGVEPNYQDHKGDDASALALVVSLNVQRRDLTGAQRAIVAAKKWGLEEKQGGRPSKDKNGSVGTVSAEQVAREFKISKHSVLDARDLIRDAPDLADQVERNAMPLTTAHDTLKDRIKEAKKNAKDAEYAREYASEYGDALADGSMSLEEILKEIQGKDRDKKERQRLNLEARQLWLEGLEKVVAWLEIAVKGTKDDHLAWYTDPAEEKIEHKLSAKRVAEAMKQLQRVAAITFAGVAKKGGKK